MKKQKMKLIYLIIFGLFSGLLHANIPKKDFTENDYFFTVLKGENNDSLVDEIKISVSPIPANEFLKIQMEDDVPAKVSILNLYGQEVFSTEIIGSTILNLSDISEGIYFINISTETIQFLKRIIIKKS